MSERDDPGAGPAPRTEPRPEGGPDVGKAYGSGPGAGPQSDAGAGYGSDYTREYGESPRAGYGAGYGRDPGGFDRGTYGGGVGGGFGGGGAGSRLLDDLARLMTDAAGVAQGARREVETVMRSQAERFVSNLDLVSREEFEAVREMASRARMENDELRARIEKLEMAQAPVATKAEG